MSLSVRQARELLEALDRCITQAESEPVAKFGLVGLWPDAKRYPRPRKVA